MRKTIIASVDLKYPLVDFDRKPLVVGSKVEVKCRMPNHVATHTVTGVIVKIDAYALTIKLDASTRPFSSNPNRPPLKGGDNYSITSPWDFDHDKKQYVGRRDINYKPEIDSTYIKKIK